MAVLPRVHFLNQDWNLCSQFAESLRATQQTTMKKPFRYGIFAKLVIGTFLSFFLLFRIEGVSGSSPLPENCLCCTLPQTRLVDTNQQQFQVAMDIPGVDPDDLEVSIDNDARTIQLVGNRRDDHGDVIGCFEKFLDVNDNVDLDSLVVQHDNGVLTVWAPKDNTRKNLAFVSSRKKEKQAFVRRGSTTKKQTNRVRSKPQEAAVIKIKPIVSARTRMERIEDPLLSEEDPMIVEPIAYDEQELLESVSVLTNDAEEEFWHHRM